MAENDAKWRASMKAQAHTDQPEAALAEAEARIRQIEASRALVARNVGIFILAFVLTLAAIMLAGLMAIR
jgi:hypothetical protein